MFYVKCDRGYIGVDKLKNPTICTYYRKAKPFEDKSKAEKFVKSIKNKFIQNVNVIFIKDEPTIKKNKIKDNFNNTKLFNQYNFKTIGNHPQMGLYNEICENPIAYCSLKRVWLDEYDVIKCFNKEDIYGYEIKVCPYIKK